MGLLEGRSAVVTGAGRGIGRDIALCLAAEGAKVVVNDVGVSLGGEGTTEDPAAQVCKEIEAAGGTAVPNHDSVSDFEAAGNIIKTAVDAFGGIDIVVNNAATNPVYGPLLQTDDGVFEKIMAVNVRGPLELTKLAHPHLVKRGGGSVINISSIGGISPEPLLGLYSVSKAALISLTKVMAREWGRDHIRVNALCPGLVRTKFSAALWQNEQTLKEFVRTLPLGRIAEPEEMVGLALFLAGPAASYCTGGVYVADGGHIM